ncbi:1-acylglycerol-3-phosphate O-acyltransferase Pnpla3-like [Dendronephthya gigantea]|uniref:1-acylglycerol-3-phosphate O-acyltransferase Pnpla3-like n=1 Tax=Dendronephthya gigantea TaxID=151771 RepID=UPI00106C6939|nr:1-acylglycerol-3-phosphate O-acyltransferase Pnpla3-like [Dendronephthya gigantea]
MDDSKETKSLSLTFSGCGFLGIYHVGVASALKDRAPKLLEKIENFGGASAGALAAGSLLCGISLSESLQFTLRLAEHARRFSIGPFHPRFQLTNTIRKVFNRMIPVDAYKRCSGKLHISLTRCSDWQNVVVSEFRSNDDLVDALVASAHVPIYSGVMPPMFRGEYYVDGGISNNLPQHFDGETITVTPWSGESDICPEDDSNSFNHIMFTNTSIRFSAQNFYRICRAFFPPDVHVLSKMCKQGYTDTIKYLKAHYPEYLIERAPRGRKVSCCCNVSGAESSKPKAKSKSIRTTSKHTSEKATVEVSKDILEKCGECNLHCLLEIAKVDVLLAEKELSNFVTKMIYTIVIKPCVLTVSKITQIAESVILKLPKISTGVNFLDLLLHTINDAILHYKIYNHTCDDSCSHKTQVYRTSIAEVGYGTYQEDDMCSEDYETEYETACSESSYVTCWSVSADSDLDETLSSSGSDTVVGEIFSPEEVQFDLTDRQLQTEYALSGKARWNVNAGILIQNFNRG